MAKTKEHWQVNTARLARAIRESAKRAHTEEDLKMAVEPLVRSSFHDLGVDVELVKYEKATGFRSKMDAVYGYLVIEYKAPGRLSSRRDVAQAKRQLQKYLNEEAQRFGSQAQPVLQKQIGVALDGTRIMFARYTRAARRFSLPVPLALPEQLELFSTQKAAVGFQFLGPYPITDASITNLLIYARASARRPLTAKDLAEVFGPDHPIARRAVTEFYSALVRAQRRRTPSRVKGFFREWDRVFGVVYGQELAKAEMAAAETARHYQLPGGVRLKQLLFAIHTYYAFLMKVIAIELLALQRDTDFSSFVASLPALDDSALQDKLAYMESGSDFVHRGIVNFLEADFFSWYLDVWETSLANALREIVRSLAEFEPATPVLEPEWTQDLLQKLYQSVVPKKLRHDLGEYYTPDWLAGYLVERSGYDGSDQTRYLDPACGSGTFLVQAIKRAIGRAEEKGSIGSRELAERILQNIVGFDLNPLAVLAARTNYLIAFSPLIRFVRPISIPVYMCDSVAPPEPRDTPDRPLLREDTVVFSTTKGDYVFPTSMKDKTQIDTFTSQVEFALRSGYDKAKFAGAIQRQLGLERAETELLSNIYKTIKDLQDRGENGIWARYIKNAFAPVYVGTFDYVVGNPPWIRWGYLSDDYRSRTLRFWQEYGIFSLKGHQTRLGAGEKDFSMLFTYSCADRYLKEGGILAFVITLEVFKSKGAGEGFRRFRIGQKGPQLKALWMEDMVHLRPFEAANKTSIFALKKGAETTYPVSVRLWRRKRGVGKIPPDWSLEQVTEATQRWRLKAAPVDPDQESSSWQTAEESILKGSDKLKGENPYKAVLGARVEPYGIFWLELKEVRPDGLLVVANQHKRGKRDIPPVQTSIESTLVFPAVAGGDLVPFGRQAWFPLLVTQHPAKRSPYSENWMLEHAPLTYAYLKQFKDILLSRGSRVVQEFARRTEFYAMYGIGEYSFARYRVVWKRMASRLQATVLSAIRTPFGTKPLISTDTTSLFALKSKEEAHYLCAIVNSQILNSFIQSFSSAGRGFGAPSVMKNIALPKFQPKEALHRRLASLSMKAHKLVAQGKDIEAERGQIDGLVEELWNINS